jgi:hypothetical protein
MALPLQIRCRERIVQAKREFARNANGIRQRMTTVRSLSYHETMEMTVAPVASAVGTGHGEMVVPSRDGLTKVQAT